MAKETVEKNYDLKLAEARQESALTSDVHSIATFIALSDARVRKLVIGFLADGYPFVGFEYPASSDFELVSVVFRFGCQSGTICIKPPHFLAVVNLITRKVEEIVDPFHGPDDSEAVMFRSGGGTKNFIVVRRTGFDGPCQVLPSDAYYLSIYTLVFGPASKEACQNFAKGCGRRPEQ